MGVLSWAGIALSVFLTLSCLSSSGSHCAAAAVSFSLLSLVFVSYLPKRKPMKHLRLISDEAAAAAVALEPKQLASALAKSAGFNQAKSELTPNQTMEMSTYSSESEEWGSLPSPTGSDNSLDGEEEDANGLIEISLPYGEGDDSGHHGKEDDAMNDIDEDGLIELDISAGFIKTTATNEQNISV